MEFGKSDIMGRRPDWEFSLGFINCRQIYIQVQPDIQGKDMAGEKNL